MRHSQERLIETLSTTIAFAQNVDLARDAQVHFKREVQEWKDVLLRGNNPADYAKYWSLFEKEEARTQAMLEEIGRRDASEAGEVGELLANLYSIGQRYRAAIVHLTAGEPLSYRAVDAEVRGMDRPLTDQMSAQVAHLQQRMAALGAQMSATNEGEISRLRWAVISAALLGMLSMVMLMLLIRRAERERAEASALAKSAFLATMSHEIRTPMNAVLGMANLLEHTSLTATQSDYLAKLQAASKHLLSIIDDILDLSKIEASRLELEHLVFSLDDVLDDVATLVGARAAEKGIELILSRQPNVPVLLLGDPLRLGQIVSNLASNAVKFTEKGEVQIAVSVRGCEGDRVSLDFEVIDSGIGLLPEEQARLFQPFAQADGSTTRRFGGTGLGLAICARLVKMMGGSIGVESQAGSGSRFFFTVPLRSRSDDRRQQPGIPPGLRGRRILVGEPNPTMREAVSQTLRSAGLSVTSVGDGVAASEALVASDSSVDLAILNWRLDTPGVWELLAQAKDKGKICPERLLVLASQIDAEQAHAALRTLGFGVLLIKPASPSTLFEAVTRAFGLEQRGRSIINRFGYWETGLRRDADEFGEAAIVRIQTAEVEAAAEMRMAPLAEVAAMARLRRVDGHPHTWPQTLYVRANGLDDAGKFVPENQRRFEDGVTNAAIKIRMQIATANTGRGDADQNLARTGLAGVGDAFDTDIERAVKTGREHGESRLHFILS